MTEDTPLLDTIMDMTEASLTNTKLDDTALMEVRLAALAAMDAPPASYLLNLAAGAEVGLTFEDARSVLVAAAPIIGTARTMTAAGNITKALGFALDVADSIEKDKVTA